MKTISNKTSKKTQKLITEYYELFTKAVLSTKDIDFDKAKFKRMEVLLSIKERSE